MAEITTVNGPIPPLRLGITHPHEHIFVDVGVWMDRRAPKRLLKVPVTPDILADLKRRDGQNLDNMVLDSFDDAIHELSYFKRAGGRSIVDVTVPGIGRDPRRLRKISAATGLNIVCGTGFYIASSHPSIVKKKSVEGLAETMIAELDDGIAGTGIRAGVIGEIGCSEPLHPREAKVIAAAGRAQARTGAGLTLHTALFDVRNKRHAKQVEQEVEILHRNDADLSKVYISHMDFTFDDPEYQRGLMERFGITLSYDTFGQDQYYNNLYPGAAGITDRERRGALLHHIRSGFSKQLLVSCDVCEKIHMRKYGGFGYANVLENVVPFLRQNGVSKREMATIMVDNPRRLLAR